MKHFIKTPIKYFFAAILSIVLMMQCIPASVMADDVPSKWVTSFSCIEQKTGTPTWNSDSDITLGHDSSDADNVVRSFDTVTYSFRLQTAAEPSTNQFDVVYEFVIPYDITYAIFDDEFLSSILTNGSYTLTYYDDNGAVLATASNERPNYLATLNMNTIDNNRFRTPVAEQKLVISKTYNLWQDYLDEQGNPVPKYDDAASFTLEGVKIDILGMTNTMTFEPTFKVYCVDNEENLSPNRLQPYNPETEELPNCYSNTGDNTIYISSVKKLDVVLRAQSSGTIYYYNGNGQPYSIQPSIFAENINAVNSNRVNENGDGIRGREVLYHWYVRLIGGLTSGSESDMKKGVEVPSSDITFDFNINTRGETGEPTVIGTPHYLGSYITNDGITPKMFPYAQYTPTSRRGTTIAYGSTNATYSSGSRIYDNTDFDSGANLSSHVKISDYIPFIDIKDWFPKYDSWSNSWTEGPVISGLSSAFFFPNDGNSAFDVETTINNVTVTYPDGTVLGPNEPLKEYIPLYNEPGNLITNTNNRSKFAGLTTSYGTGGKMYKRIWYAHRTSNKWNDTTSSNIQALNTNINAYFGSQNKYALSSSLRDEKMQLCSSCAQDNSNYRVKDLNLLTKFDSYRIKYDTTANYVSNYTSSNLRVIFAADPLYPNGYDTMQYNEHYIDGVLYGGAIRMNLAGQDDLIYFSTLEELEAAGYTCIGMMSELRGVETNFVSGLIVRYPVLWTENAKPNDVAAASVEFYQYSEAAVEHTGMLPNSLSWTANNPDLSNDPFKLIGAPDEEFLHTLVSGIYMKQIRTCAIFSKEYLDYTINEVGCIYSNTDQYMDDRMNLEGVDGSVVKKVTRTTAQQYAIGLNMTDAKYMTFRWYCKYIDKDGVQHTTYSSILHADIDKAKSYNVKYAKSNNWNTNPITDIQTSREWLNDGLMYRVDYAQTHPTNSPVKVFDYSMSDYRVASNANGKQQTSYYSPIYLGTEYNDKPQVLRICKSMHVLGHDVFLLEKIPSVQTTVDHTQYNLDINDRSPVYSITPKVNVDNSIELSQLEDTAKTEDLTIDFVYMKTKGSTNYPERGLLFDNVIVESQEKAISSDPNNPTTLSINGNIYSAYYEILSSKTISQPSSFAGTGTGIRIHLIDAPVGFDLPVINVIPTIGIGDNKTLICETTITSSSQFSNDHYDNGGSGKREKTINQVSINTIREKDDSFVKSLDFANNPSNENYIEIGGVIHYVVQYTCYSGAKRENLQIYDIFPFTGDQRNNNIYHTEGTMDYDLIDINVNVSTGESYSISYTTATPSEINISNDFSNFDSVFNLDGSNIVSNATGFGITIPELQGPSQVTIDFKLKTNNNSIEEIYANDTYLKYNAADKPMIAGPVQTKVVHRSLSGMAWYDSNANGEKDLLEVYLPFILVHLEKYSNGTWVQATDLEGEPVTPILTDMNGYYLFDNLPSGIYRMIFDVNESHEVDGPYIDVTDKERINSNPEINSKGEYIDNTYYVRNVSGKLISLPSLEDLSLPGVSKTSDITSLNIGLITGRPILPLSGYSTYIVVISIGTIGLIIVVILLRKQNKMVLKEEQESE